MERPILVLGNCVQGTRMQWKMKDHQANIIKQQFSKENFVKFYFAQMSSVYTLYIYIHLQTGQRICKNTICTSCADPKKTEGATLRTTTQENAIEEAFGIKGLHYPCILNF